VIDPGDFAAYVFTIVAAVGGLTVIGTIARRIAGGGLRRRRIGRAGETTDPGQADAIRVLAAELETVRDEVSGMRRELDEAHNRLDFTERLLAQAKERGLLNAPKAP